jgi:hypothetical protein
MVPRRTHLIAVATAVLVVFGAACSGGDDDGTGRVTPGPATTVSGPEGDVLRDCPPGTDTAGVIPARGAAADAGLDGTITLAASHPTEGRSRRRRASPRGTGPTSRR